MLKKLHAGVVVSWGGARSLQKLVTEDLARARKANRKILIYPEGRLGEPGYHIEYKKGIFHMYEAYQCPVIPVATNLGLYWPHMTFNNFAPGTAVVEFLEPIQPGLGKEEFMALLEERIESASLALLPDDFEVPEHRLLVFDKELDRGVPAPRPEDDISKAAE